MTEKDKSLIADARATYLHDWAQISALIEQADTDEARNKLKALQRYYRCLEEAKDGVD